MRLPPRRLPCSGFALSLLAVFPLLSLPLYAEASSNPDSSSLNCDESLRDVFTSETETKVLLIREFRTGEALSLAEPPAADAPKATADVCVVKLLVGPGNPGPAEAPSTSPGIGIEIWLPSPKNWNERIHIKGGGGWAGGVQGSTSALAGTTTGSAGSVAQTAMIEGAVSASTDTGHRDANGAFTYNPDGSINTALWNDFSARSLKEMAVKTRLLTEAYYGKPARYRYFNGFSTGGRQGHKLAQVFPEEFDGILAGAPAFNWTRFITAELYPQIVFQRDLGGTNLTTAQLDAVSNAAIAACDLAGGQHLGYIADPAACHYDPSRDATLLCEGQIGTGNVQGSSKDKLCFTFAQAQAVNKIWYGQTTDGSVPDPEQDNGWALEPTGKHLWYGVTRGTSLLGLAGAEPFSIAADMVAIELGNFTLGLPVSRGTPFANATLGTGANAWRELGYGQLEEAGKRGLELQPQFAHINTDNPDLTAFRDSGGKMIMYHGLADIVIPPQGSVNYYHRVSKTMGGLEKIQDFYRFYLIPGMAHGFRNGTSNPNANPPLPTNDQLYEALTRWVEQGMEPGTQIAQAPATEISPAKARPLCVYPLQAHYQMGDPNQLASYSCSP